MSDPSTVVSAAPFVADMKPYLDVVVDAVITAGIGVGIAYLRKKWGLDVSSDAEAKIDKAAEHAAGAMMAAAEDNLANQTINVGDQRVAAAAAKIAAIMPDALAAARITPEAVAQKVAGEIGKLQAQIALATAPAK